MLHYIKSDNGDGSSSLWWFSTKQRAMEYATHPTNEEYCRDGDGVTYGCVDAIPGPTFTFDDNWNTEL